MATRRRALCFAAHPDDLETYMGMTLLLLLAGDVHAVVATDGEAGTLQPRSGTRVDEARRVFAELGIAGRFLGLPDGGLDGVTDLPERLATIVAELRPDIVFAPHATDPHADHAALAHAAPEPCWRWLPAVPGVAPDVLVAGDFDRKVELIEGHGSQIPGPAESRAHLPGGSDILERARQRDARYGSEVGVAHAEPLVVPIGVPAAGKPPRLVRELEGFFGGAE